LSTCYSCRGRWSLIVCISKAGRTSHGTLQKSVRDVLTLANPKKGQKYCRPVKHMLS